MILAKPLDRPISNIKYRLGKYYVRMDLTPLPKVRVCRDFSNPSPPYSYVKFQFVFQHNKMLLVKEQLH
jgi:hypothetical protein